MNDWPELLFREGEPTAMNDQSSTGPITAPGPRRFVLQRDEDETGVSGTGLVAEGCVYSDGYASVRWVVGAHRSTVTWDSLQSVEAIHGHDGRTRIVWID